MKKVKIGIPRAMLYYKYGVLWKNFFENLGLNVIISPETSNKILELGIKNTIDESCLAYKIYIGHVIYLSNICDYILVTRLCDYGKKDKTCTRFNATYDNIRYLINEDQLIEYNIEHTKLKYQFLELIKIGFKFTKNPIKIILSYIYAKKKQDRYNQIKINEQKSKLKDNHKKILILSHDYNLEDKFVSGYIKDYFKKANITLIYPNCLDSKILVNFSKYFSNTLYWKFSKEIIGALYYYKHQIDGLIYISTYPCGIDALVNNLAILKNKEIPTLNLIIDENITEVSLETKLESFTDIINGEIYE